MSKNIIILVENIYDENIKCREILCPFYEDIISYPVFNDVISVELVSNHAGFTLLHKNISQFFSLYPVP